MTKKVSPKKKYVYFAFKNGKLVSVITSVMDNYEDAVNCDYPVVNPRNAKKQIEDWMVANQRSQD